MPTECDKCGEKHYAIHLTRERKRLCGKCYDKDRPKVEWDPDDLTRRQRSY